MNNNLYRNRIEYDAHRYDYQVLANKNQINQNIQKQYEHFKLIYEKSKEDLNVKFKFLDQNRVCFLLSNLYLWKCEFIDWSNDPTIDAFS